jgi:signal transduction histidine kinase
VSDSGPGIAAADLERIFEPFEQGDISAARPHGGAGLGLAVARRSARLMGGELLCESTPGRGATFVLTVPAAPRAL